MKEREDMAEAGGAREESIEAEKVWELAIGTAYIPAPLKPLPERLAAVAAAGFRCVHWTDRNPSFRYDEAFARDMARMLDSEGLRCFGVHSALSSRGSPWSADPEARSAGLQFLFNRAVFCARLGAGVLVVHPPPPGEAETVFEAVMPEWLRGVAKEGVRVAIENDQAPGTGDRLGRLFQRCGLGDLGFCFDIGHAHLAGEEELLARFSDRVACLHLHDNDGTRDAHGLPFDGQADWSAFASRLRETVYPGPLVLEVEAGTAEAESFLRGAMERGRRLARMLNGLPNGDKG